ncbi:MAG: FHA domain-containing protein [Deltaproteobacteria bacterium]|nr:FHA domain-containing protein [Deltaproteobacteria bacterium]
MASHDIAQLALELEADGEASFLVRHSSPVLVGQGVVGQLEEEQSKKRRGRTIGVSMSLDELAAQPVSLKNRVWEIRRDGPRAEGVPISVGRVAGNDVVIPEYSVSEHHCAFRWHKSRWMLSDLGSMNGTVLDSQRLEPFSQVAVPDGALVALGRYQFRFWLPKSFLGVLSPPR